MPAVRNATGPLYKATFDPVITVIFPQTVRLPVTYAVNPAARLTYNSLLCLSKCSLKTPQQSIPPASAHPLDFSLTRLRSRWHNHIQIIHWETREVFGRVEGRGRRAL